MTIAVEARVPGMATKHSDGMQHVFARDEWDYVRIDLSANDPVVFNGGAPAVLGPIFVESAMSAHACPILDGEATAFNLPASLAAGTVVDWCAGIRFEDGLSINSNDSATGTIVVLWRPL